MTSKFFDRAYRTTKPNEVQDLYEDWAETYDKDVVENGYMTPARCAKALAQILEDRAAPIFDFACGSGLSGLELAKAGFTVIDGADISSSMLEIAKGRNVYRSLIKAEPNDPPGAEGGNYAAISAIGALSPGAAPATFFDALLSQLPIGGLFVLSYNDHTLADADYTSRLDRAIESGRTKLRFQEQGDHIIKLGSKSNVYVLEKMITD